MPAIVTRSIAGSSMAANDAFAPCDTPFGEVGLLAPLVPDVALMHALVADREGNVVVHPPLLEGIWGALAAQRGVIVTVERIVDDVRPWSHLVRIPAHRVLAVVECPMGAHPGGLYTGDVPVDGYGEDYDFWVDARAATRAGADEYDAWIQHWVLDVETQEQWLERLGPERIDDAARQGRSRVVARRRRGVPARSRRARERVGARRGVGRAPSRGARRRDRARTRCSRARASPTSRRGSACRSRATPAPT